MRRVVARSVFVTLVLASLGARADDLDGWCAQVKKASSIVICSDPELRQQALARNRLFEAAREQLSAEAYKALTADQTRWVKSYTARCGVSMDAPVPPVPILQTVIDCYRRESRARTAELTSRYPEAAVVALGSGTAASRPSPDTATPPPPTYSPATSPKARQDLARNEWFTCLMEAADALSDQPEPARTVAEAAYGSCGNYEVAYGQAHGLDLEGVDRIKAEALTPKVLARVMADRAVRAKLQKETPSRTSPAIDYNRM